MQASTGQGDRSQAALIRAYYQARGTGDFGRIERAALNLPSSQQFGAHPGQVPALVHEAYAAAIAPLSRCRLAAALARAWAYGGEADRAVSFADEAVRLAEAIGEPGILADALDAALLARWGPDSFAQRLEQSAQLASAAAHLADPELRLSAYLWRLTTAWECLDVIAVQRQLRALDMLAEETGADRIAFFAASRRAMHALVTADLDVADQLIARTGQTGAPWRDVPGRYGPWQSAYELFRRWQRDGAWRRILTALQGGADAAGLITWDVSVDSTVARAHQHAAGARKRGICRPSRPAASMTSPPITAWAVPAAG
jgi:transposase